MSEFTIKDKVAIAGLGETSYYKRGAAPVSEFRLALEAIQKAAADAGWDLVVIDEAHHLRGGRAYEVAQGLSRRTWGLLLLTATPLQLDPAEYHALLRLVDPAPAATRSCMPDRCGRVRPRRSGPAPRGRAARPGAR